MAVTFRGMNNSIIEGVRFVQSQMWYVPNPRTLKSRNRAEDGTDGLKGR